MSASMEQMPRGLRAAWTGSLVALSTPKFRRKYTEYFVVMNGPALGLFIVMAALYVPWRIMLWLASFVISTRSAEMGWIEGMGQLMIQCWVVVPMVGLSFLRFASGTLFKYSEVVYFAVLSELDPDLCQRQRSVSPVGTVKALMIYCQRMLRLLGLSTLLLITYNLPYIGQLAVPMAQLYMIGQVFGLHPALFLMACYGVAAYAGEAVSTWALLVFQLWISAVGLSRELLEPFFARLPDYRKHPAILRKRYYKLMIGFGLPFALLLPVPLVGPLVWGLAQAAIAALVVEMEKREQQQQPLAH